MPLSLPEYHYALNRVRTVTSDQLVRFWDGLGSWRDADVARFVRVAVPKVQAAQFMAARLTANHLGGPVLDRDVLTSVRGVPQSVEYSRPGVKAWTVLSAGGALADAVRQGSQLVRSLSLTDIQLAVTHQSRAAIAQSGATRFRRVLTGLESCDLCRIAAQNVYSRENLLPIHSGCDCTVEPIYDAPDYSLDTGDLSLTDARRADLDAGAAPESLIAVHEHGETGPTLTWASDHFTGPADIAA